MNSATWGIRSNIDHMWIVLKTLGFVALALAIGLVVMHFVRAREVSVAQAETPDAVDDRGEPYGTVAAEWLIGTYHENEVAADHHIKGKRIGVMGDVFQIARCPATTPASDVGCDDFEGAMVLLTCPRFPTAAVLVRLANEADADHLQRGMKMQYRCVGGGVARNRLGPLLVDCY